MKHHRFVGKIVKKNCLILPSPAPMLVGTFNLEVLKYKIITIHSFSDMRMPFSLLSTSLLGSLRIDCCITMGVHYCDISGEIPWSRRITPLNKYAQRNKAGRPAEVKKG